MRIIKAMQLSPTLEVFKKFADHIKSHFPVDYEKSKIYMEKITNWYEGFYNGPSTNNSLEAFNAVIKRQYTMSERLPLHSFLKKMIGMLHDQSYERSESCKNFKEIATCPTISQDLWEKVYACYRKKDYKKVFITRSENSFPKKTSHDLDFRDD